MAKKIKNDNIKSLFWENENGGYDYIDEGVKNVSSNRPKLDRNQRNELAGSGEQNLGLHSVRAEKEHTNTNEGNLFGDDEVLGNADERERNRTDNVFGSVDTQGSRNAKSSERTNADRHKSNETNTNNDFRTSQFHNQLQSDTYNGNSNDTSLFDEPTNRPVDTKTTIGNSTIHRPTTNGNVDEIRQASDTRRLHELDISTTNSTSLGGTTSEYGNGGRYSEANLFNERNSIEETGTSNTIPNDVGIRSTGKSESQTAQGNGEYGLGNIQNTGNGYLQGISSNDTSSISDERNKGESVSLLNNKVGTHDEVSADNKILKENYSFNDLNYLQTTQQFNVIMDFWHKYEKELKEAEIKFYEWVYNLDRDSVVSEHSDKLTFSGDEFRQNIQGVTSNLSKFAIKNDDFLPEIARSFWSELHKNDKFGNMVAKGLDHDSKAYKELNQLVFDMSVFKALNSSEIKEFQKNISGTEYQEFMRKQFQDLNFGIQAINEGNCLWNEIGNRAREIQKTQYTQEAVDKIKEKLSQNDDLKQVAIANEYSVFRKIYYDFAKNAVADLYDTDTKSYDYLLYNFNYVEITNLFDKEIYQRYNTFKSEVNKTNEADFIANENNKTSTTDILSELPQSSKQKLDSEFNIFEVKKNRDQICIIANKKDDENFIREFVYFGDDYRFMQTNLLSQEKYNEIATQIRQDKFFANIGEHFERFRDNNGKIDLYSNYEAVLKNELVQNELKHYKIKIRNTPIPANAKILGRNDTEYFYGDFFNENQMYRLTYRYENEYGGGTASALTTSNETERFIESQRGMLAQLIADYEKERKYKEKSVDINEITTKSETELTELEKLAKTEFEKVQNRYNQTEKPKTYINKEQTEIFNVILNELGDKEYIKFVGQNGFMDLDVDNLGNIKLNGEIHKHISMAHNSEQNGDLMADPDMEFAVSKQGVIIPLTFQNDYAGSYDSAINDNNTINEKKAKELAKFTNLWLDNLNSQHKLLEKGYLTQDLHYWTNEEKEKEIKNLKEVFAEAVKIRENQQSELKNDLNFKVFSTGTNVDFVVDENIDTAKIGKKEKFRNNIQALKLAKELYEIKQKALKEQKNFTIARQEQEILAKFSGWGGISEAFDPKNENWTNEYKELKEILSDKSEYDEARASTTTAFYTPKLIIDTMYNALDQMGINNDENTKKILEPSAGNGAFLAQAKNHLKSEYEFNVAEIEPNSNKFLNLLYPNSKVFSHKLGFQDISISGRTQYDLVIGNPPYDNFRIYDKNNPDISGMMVHNYFTAKGLKHLKDKGIMAFVVTHNFLDSKNNETREQIAKEATFLGAVRLPNTAFKDEAKTEVVTDIVFFQKGINKEIAEKNVSWLSTTEYTATEQGSFEINSYFKENPQNVLGNLQVTSSQFGYELTCKENQNIDLKTALENFVKNELPKNIYEYTQGKTIDENLFVISKFNEKYQANSDYYDNLKEGNFLIFNNEIYQKQNSLSDDEAIFKKISVGKTDEKKIRNFIDIRDLREKLLKLEATDIADDNPKLLNKRLELKTAYDKYHKDGYFLSDSKTNKILRDSLNGDPDFYKVSSLEKNFKKGISKKRADELGIEPAKSSCEDADILSKRVIYPTPIFEFDNTKDGLFASINKFGKVDIDFISTKLNKEAHEVENELLNQKLIFLDPALFQKGEKEFIFAPKYLSGNVREKLKIAEEVAKDEPRFSHNILALKEVVPKDIQAHDITTNIGAGWIPQKYYREFFMKEFNIDESKFSLSYSEKTGVWNIGGDDWYMNYSIREKFSYTHPQSRAKNKSVYDIAGYALSGTSPRITKDSDEALLNKDGSIKTDSNGNTMYKQILDVVATQEVQRKVNIIKNDFEEWIFKDYTRRKDLQDIYNDKFNCYVRKNYDGETFKFEGINEAFKLRKHQKDAVVRAINDKVVLLDHEVGAGKTLTAICSIMEQKKLGVVNKPLVVVPNHLVKQWQSEFLNAYPQANILVADENSMSKDKRDEFLAKITNGNFDAIIMKFTQFERIPVPIEIEKKVLNEQIFELEEAIKLREADENFSGRRYSVKRLESAKEKLEQKLKNSIEKAEKTKMIDFSELGIDYLIVDESHSFKNLQFSTMLENVKGLGNPQGSNRAIDMFMKTTYMHEQEKAKIMFLTGTPVSNSLVELYLVQKYLSPNELSNNGLSSFDGWAKTYGKIEQVFEAGVIPNDYKVANRFTSFENLQTLGMQYLDFADIITNAEIKKFNGDFVPNAEIVVTQSAKSDKVAEYIGIENEYGSYNEGSIIWRLENMPSDPSQDNHLKITNDAKKAGLDFRLINPNAEDDPNSKINKAVENIYKEYEAWNSDKGTQLVFLDIGTPKSNSQLSKNINLDEINTQIKEGNFEADEERAEFVNINEILQNDEIKDDFKDDEIVSERDANEKTFFLYGDIYKKLVSKGIPREQIAFIHDANTNNEKQELFDKVNSGEIRVLIGSTSKMGAGTNVQERVTAIHHIDCPWKPSDLTQRNGRVIRQGNKLFERDPQNFKVKDYRYVTTGTYDEASWQIVTAKAKAILNFRTGVLEGNSLDGFEDEVVNSELLKASANEEPLYLLQHKIKNALDELEREQKSFTQNRNTQENELASSQSLVNYYAKNIEILKQTKEYVAKFPNDDMLRINIIQNNIDKTETLHKFEIPNNAKDETKLMQTQMKNMLLNNIDLILKQPNRDFNICEYKGFVVSGYYDQPTSSVIFELKSKENGEILSPKNLVYESKEKGVLEVSNLKNQISAEGFLIRLNNYFKGIDKNIDEYSENLSKNNDKIATLKQVLSTSSEFPKAKMISALKDDLNTCFAELGKRKEDKSYKSSFESEALKLFDESKKTKKHNFDIDNNGSIQNNGNDIKQIQTTENNNKAVGFD